MILTNPSQPAIVSVKQGYPYKDYVGRAYQGPTVGRYSCAQLLNPSASGIIVLCWRILTRVVSSGNCQIQTSATALTTDTAAELGLTLGTAAGTAQVRRDAAAAIPGTTLWIHRLTANVPTAIWSDRNILLPANTGLVIANATANNDIDVTFFWTEL